MNSEEEMCLIPTMIKKKAKVGKYGSLTKIADKIEAMFCNVKHHHLHFF